MKKGGVNLLIALELYSRAMEINPENIRVASSLINSLLWRGDGKGALQVCDTALYYNPDNRQIRQSQGMALYLTRNYQKADTVYSSLLAEGDSSFINLKYAGASRFMAGHTLDAVEPLEEQAVDGRFTEVDQSTSRPSRIRKEAPRTDESCHEEIRRARKESGHSEKQTVAVSFHYEDSNNFSSSQTIKLSGELQRRTYRIRMAHFEEGAVCYKILNTQPFVVKNGMKHLI